MCLLHHNYILEGGTEEDCVGDGEGTVENNDEIFK